MLILYSDPVSLYCAKLRIVLRHKQLNWQELPPPGGYGSDTYAQLVPAGSLPALADGDLLLADSEAIAEYLNEKYTAYPLLPNDILLRAKARERSRFHDTRLEPQVRALFSQVNITNRDKAFVSEQAVKINQNLAYLSQLLESSDPSLNETLTLADCGFVISFVWIDQLFKELDIEAQWPKAVASYRNHIQQFTAVKEELNDYLPKASAWVKNVSAK